MYPETVQTPLADLVPMITSPSMDLPPFQDLHLPYRLLPTADLLPLPLMPQTGLPTTVVSSPLVTQTLITVSYLLVILALIGSSKTHGVVHGENPDISEWPLVIPVVLSMMFAMLEHETELIINK